MSKMVDREGAIENYTTIVYMRTKTWQRLLDSDVQERDILSTNEFMGIRGFALKYWSRTPSLVV